MTRKPGGRGTRAGGQGKSPGPGRRSMRKAVLIFCEGRETERNYFYGLVREQHVRNLFRVTVKKGRGGSPEDVVKGAAEQKKLGDYDEVYCVLDADAGRESLQRARDLAKPLEIGLVLSNPSFEVWLLSHFERKSRVYSSCDQVIVALNTHWREHCRRDYEKNDEDIYSRIASLTPAAIDNAEAVRQIDHRGCPDITDANSSTEAYLLVRYLLGMASAPPH